MKITWLGQAGLLFEARGKKIMVDPYLSNSCGRLNPLSNRRVPVDEKFLEMKPDIIILTHDHLDHTDPETLERYLCGEENVTVLASYNAWCKARTIGSGNNYVNFNRHTQWTQDGFKFYGVKADHSDLYAIGVIIDDGEKKYYVTGDTLYNTDIFEDLPDDIEAVFLPVNGVGNNLNMEDALRFARDCGARKAVPLHVGLFDDKKPVGFEIVPEFFGEIKL